MIPVAFGKYTRKDGESTALVEWRIGGQTETDDALLICCGVQQDVIHQQVSQALSSETSVDSNVS